MDLLLLGIYAFFVWLIFIKLKWLPWNTAWQVTVVIIPIVALSILILTLNVVAPSTADVRVIKYVVQVVPQVRGDKRVGARSHAQERLWRFHERSHSSAWHSEVNRSKRRTDQAATPCRGMCALASRGLPWRPRGHGACARARCGSARANCKRAHL